MDDSAIYSKAITMGLNFVIPGFGTAVSLVIKLLSTGPDWQGNNPATQSHFYHNVALPVITAAKASDFSDAAAALAYHNGYPYYEHFGGSASRWPQVAPAFYAVMIGNAIATGDWRKADQFFGWLDPVVAEGKAYIADGERHAAIAATFEDPEGRQYRASDYAPALEVETAGQFWASPALAGAVDSLESFLSKVATSFGIGFTPTGSALESVRQFRASIEARRSRAAVTAAYQQTANGSISMLQARFSQAIANAQRQAKEIAAASVARLQAREKAIYDAAVSTAKARAGARFLSNGKAAADQARANLARGMSKAAAQTKYADTISAAKQLAASELNAAANAAQLKATDAIGAGIRGAQADAMRIYNSLVTAARNEAIQDQQIVAFIATHINEPAAIRAEADRRGLGVEDIVRATGFERSKVAAYFENAQIAPPIGAGNSVDSQIAAFVRQNIEDPGKIAAAANQAGISDADIARATGYSEIEVRDYLDQAAPPGGTHADIQTPGPIVAPAEIARFVAANLDDPGAIARAAIEAGVSDAEIAKASGYTEQQVRDFLAPARA